MVMLNKVKHCNIDFAPDVDKKLEMLSRVYNAKDLAVEVFPLYVDMATADMGLLVEEQSSNNISRLLPYLSAIAYVLVDSSKGVANRINADIWLKEELDPECIPYGFNTLRKSGGKIVYRTRKICGAPGEIFYQIRGKS